MLNTQLFAKNPSTCRSDWDFDLDRTSGKHQGLSERISTTKQNLNV